MKRANIYKRKNVIYLHSSSMTTAGIWMATQPFVAIDISEDDVVKVNHIKNALEQSREYVPHPVRSSNLFEPILKLAGVTSYSEFTESARSCSIELEGRRLRFIPYRNLGPRIGHEEITGRIKSVSINASAERIAATLESAFDACE